MQRPKTTVGKDLTIQRRAKILNQLESQGHVKVVIPDGIYAKDLCVCGTYCSYQNNHNGL